MMNLTQDIYEALIPFEKYLRQAYFGNFLGTMSSFQANDLIKLYVQAGGTQAMSPSCVTCKMTLCKTMGKLYFKWIEDHKQKEADTADNNTEVEQSTEETKKPQEKTKKGGRKGKQCLKD